MGYYYRGRLWMPADSPDYYPVSGALSRAGFFQEVSTVGELRKRLNDATPSLPLGAEVKTERVYRMSRGYEPDKPRSGTVDREEVLVLVDRGAFYDPKTGKARPPRWKKRTGERDTERGGRRVPRSWVEAAGRNYGADRMRAPLRVQQRFYERWMRIARELSPEDREKLNDLGREWWESRALRGPGVDW